MKAKQRLKVHLSVCMVRKFQDAGSYWKQERGKARFFSFRRGRKKKKEKGRENDITHNFISELKLQRL